MNLDQIAYFGVVRLRFLQFASIMRYVRIAFESLRWHFIGQIILTNKGVSRLFTDHNS